MLKRRRARARPSDRGVPETWTGFDRVCHGATEASRGSNSREEEVEEIDGRGWASRALRHRIALHTAGENQMWVRWTALTPGELVRREDLTPAESILCDEAILYVSRRGRDRQVD